MNMNNNIEENKYTEDEIKEIADQLDENDLGLLITTWMNSNRAVKLTIECHDPNGETFYFELNRIAQNYNFKFWQ